MTMARFGASLWWAPEWDRHRRLPPKSSAERPPHSCRRRARRLPSSTSRGLEYDADAAARVGLGAALRSWRYDRYRTKLKDNQKPTLEEIVIVGGDAGAGKRYEQRWAPVVEGVSLTRELVTEPANIIYPETFVERVKASIEGSGLETRGA